MDAFGLKRRACSCLRRRSSADAKMNSRSEHLSKVSRYGFVAKYFGEGLRPLIWFGEPKPEDVLWAITRALWPSLRVEFACCTYSLQPRSLDDRPFDLLFAPLSAQSRFLKLPRENILSAPFQRGQEDPINKIEEPWHRTFANEIFGNSSEKHVVNVEVDEFSSLLGKDPTAIRNLFLIKTLWERVDESPTASIGLMDAVGALAPGEHQIVDYKRELAATALRAAENVSDADEALKCYFLIGELLVRLPFREVATSVENQLCEAVAQRTTQNAEAALSLGERLLTPDSSINDSAYAKGIIAGLIKLVTDDPTQLVALHQYPVAAASIIKTEPIIAQGFLRGMKQQRATSVAEADLVAWLNTSTDPNVYARLQSSLLSQIEGDDEFVLAEELLANVHRASVIGILDTLSRTTQNFSAPRIRQIIGERISEVFPEEVRLWSKSTDTWSEGIAEVIAAAYPTNAIGFSKLLEDSQRSPARKAEVITLFLDAVTLRGFPFWLKDYLRRDASLLFQVLASGRKTPQRASNIVSKVLEEVRDLPVAISTDMIGKIEDVKHLFFIDTLVDRALRSAITCFIKGEIDADSFRAWQEPKWSVNWFERVDRWDLESLLVTGSYDNPQAWGRAWEWMSKAPEVLYYRDPPVMPLLVEKLIAARRKDWDWDSSWTGTWITVLQRTSHAKQNLAHLHLCSHALDYSFSHKEYPLGGLVAELFWKVYKTILKAPSVSPMTSIIFSIISWIAPDWDKGKDLRQRLVNEFMNSNWAPGDLAIAARDTELLRKIFKRIMGQADGEHYAAAMLRDLKGRNDPLAVRTANTLAKLIRNPNFEEPWE